MAHILFTSGSTGTPKGVVITHANVVSFIEWAVPHFGIRPADRVSGHPPLHFDLSTFDIYGAFAAGAELHLVPPELGVDPHRLAALIRDAELTQWFSVPSVLTYMAKFDAVSHNDFPTLVRLMWCGEVLPTPILVHWMTRLPHVRFTNLYGPTEATIASSHHTVRECPTDPAQPIPIGVACANEELLVLDDERRAVPQGEIGEIFIAGAGLSPGYWRDEEKTRVAFLPDPRPGHEGGRIYRTGDLGRVDDDGRIEFLGRVDSQIKSRGYRIELGEIEAALSAIVEVRECAVVGVDTGEFGGTEICSAYASVAGRTVERAYLRGELSKVLPSYMLPTHWRRFDRLPKNVNGKIDRRAIRELFQADLARPRATASSAGGA
jgi:amino acid adenylation domain-containing protein